MGELLTPSHLIVIAVIALVLFDGNNLPELGKGLGEGLRGFKDGIKGLTDDVDSPGKAAQTAHQNPTNHHSDLAQYPLFPASITEDIRISNT